MVSLLMIPSWGEPPREILLLDIDDLDSIEDVYIQPVALGILA
jgi:hypothetical protein